MIAWLHFATGMSLLILCAFFVTEVLRLIWMFLSYLGARLRYNSAKTIHDEALLARERALAQYDAVAARILGRGRAIHMPASNPMSAPAIYTSKVKFRCTDCEKPTLAAPLVPSSAVLTETTLFGVGVVCMHCNKGHLVAVEVGPKDRIPNDFACFKK